MSVDMVREWGTVYSIDYKNSISFARKFCEEKDT